MNVSSSTSTSNSINQASSTAISTNSKQSSEGMPSFDEEMKNVDSPENKEQNLTKNEDVSNQKTENVLLNSTNSKDKQGFDKNILKKDHTALKDSSSKISTSDLLTLNIQQLLDTQNKISDKTEIFNVSVIVSEDLSQKVGQNLDYSNIEMTEADAQFFIDIVKNNNVGLQNVVQDVQQALEFGVEEVQKSADVSKTLLNALHNSVKIGQAFRIDFGNDVAVIMRVGKDGTIMANFIPGDKAVEEYLKNNISFLKQRFDEEDIPYSQLSYSQHQQRRQQQNNKENKHE